jgi:hypothetical protein
VLLPQEIDAAPIVATHTAHLVALAREDDMAPIVGSKRRNGQRRGP